MLNRIENILIDQRFWIAAIVILIAVPFVMTFLQWLDAQTDFVALCRGFLFGGR